MSELRAIRKITILQFCFLIVTQYAVAFTYRSDIKPIIDKQCASCHKGPYLDLREYPFFSDIFPKQEVLVGEMIKRMRRTDLKRMPPVNFPAVEEKDIQLIEAWLKEGLGE